MLKSILSIAAVLAVSSFAQANDASIPKIDVKGIKPGGVKVGQKITIYGGNSADFFNMLPAAALAGDDGTHAAKNRTLSLISKRYSVNLSCSKETGTTVCEISLNEGGSDDGDHHDVKPVCQ